MLLLVVFVETSIVGRERFVMTHKRYCAGHQEESSHSLSGSI